MDWNLYSVHFLKVYVGVYLKRNRFPYKQENAKKNPTSVHSPWALWRQTLALESSSMRKYFIVYNKTYLHMISFEFLKYPVKKEVLLTLWWQSMILFQIICCFSMRELDTLLTPCRLCCLCGGSLIFLSLAQWNVRLKDHASCHCSCCPLHKAKATKQILLGPRLKDLHEAEPQNHSWELKHSHCMG